MGYFCIPVCLALWCKIIIVDNILRVCPFLARMFTQSPFFLLSSSTLLKLEKMMTNWGFCYNGLFFIYIIKCVHEKWKGPKRALHHIQLLKRDNMKPLQSLSGRHAKLLCKQDNDDIIMKVQGHQDDIIIKVWCYACASL